jgi:hypothetical protein
MNDLAGLPTLDGEDLDAAFAQARATLTSLLRAPGRGAGA